MTKLFFTLFVCISLISCDSNKKTDLDLYAYIPESSSLIIESENISGFLENVDDNTILKNSEIIQNQNLSGLHKFSSTFPPSNSWTCFVEIDQLAYDYIFITKSIVDSLRARPKKDFSIESFTTDDFSYQKTTIEKSIIYSTKVRDMIIASNSLKTLRTASNMKESSLAKSQNFKKAIAARTKGKTSLFINHPVFSSYNNLSDKKLNSSHNYFGEWSVVDLDLNNHKITYNGIALANEQSNQFLNIFQGIQQHRNEISKIVPAASSGFYSFTYNNFSNLSKNLRSFNVDSLIIPDSFILSYTKEAGMIYIEDETAIALTVMDPQLALEAFPFTSEIAKEFRGINIHSVSEIKFLKYFEPLLIMETPRYFSLIDNFLVFSEKQETLEKIISSFQNNLTFQNSIAFAEVQETLADASSLLIVTKPSLSSNKSIESLILDNFRPLTNLSNEYALAATQLVSNKGFTHIHGVILAEAGENTLNSQEFKTYTHSLQITGKAYVLKNHNSQEFEIAQQNEDNELSLITLEGKVLWKKKLQSQIVGEVLQVDLFKNGNLQMAFTTLNKLHVLDRNGNYVKPFPLDLKDEITQPLAIFDYDNRKNYRFVIVQKNDLLMFDSNGKAVKGFDLKKTASEIMKSPKHIRIQNKDYIVFPEKNGKLHALSRQGKPRIPIKEKMNFSESVWYDNEKELVSISEEGKLVKIDQKGKVNKRDLTSVGDMRIAANETILVLLSENILKINDNEITLDFGLYSSPKIHKVSTGSFISVTDTQAKKVYLFNEQGALVPNFPVYGISLLELSNSKISNKSTLIVLGENNELISYDF